MLLARFCILLFLLPFLLSCGSEEVQRRPNILFLFADDQRSDTVSAYGNPDISTPNLDRLVARGFSFRSNYNMGSEQGAVCVPSRAMVNTGRDLFGVSTDMSDAKILPELLAENGYVTFATGKWHNKRPSWLRGFQYGKNVFFGGMSDHTQVPLEDLLPDGTLGNQRTGEGFSSELFADTVIEFLSNYEDEKPFYAYVPFTSPHDPRQPPEEFRQMYYQTALALPENFMSQHPFDLGPHLTGRDEKLASWPREESVILDQIAEYYGMVTHLDQQIGRILETLEERGLSNNTIIIYAADQGLAMGSHGLLGKQNVYEHSQHCPLIFVGPGIPENGSSDALTYLFDIYPTLLNLVGIQPPAGTDGLDLSPIWQGEKTKVRNSLFLAYMDEMRAVRDEQYKLIRYPQIGFTQLFDLKNDPAELNNLAEAPGQEERVSNLLNLLEGWQIRVGDTLPLTVENPRPMEIDLSGKEREPDRWQPAWIVDKYF